MAKIQLSNGMVVLVDKEDIPVVEVYKWHFDGRYATANIARGKKVYLHRLIMKIKDDMEVDHKNRNKLDCRRKNLRVISKADHRKHHHAHMIENIDYAKMWETRREKYGKSGRRNENSFVAPSQLTASAATLFQKRTRW